MTSTQSLLVYSRCAVGMLPRLGVRPALLDLCCELAEPVCTEDLELLLVSEIPTLFASLFFSMKDKRSSIRIRRRSNTLCWHWRCSPTLGSGSASIVAIS